MAPNGGGRSPRLDGLGLASWDAAVERERAPAECGLDLAVRRPVRGLGEDAG